MGNYEDRKVQKQKKYGNTILFNSEKNLLVREVAKTAGTFGVIIGEKKLWNTLREWGFIFKNSTEPMQHGLNRGLFVIVEGIKTTDYYRISFHTTKVTPKGQQYIINRLINERN